MSSSDDKMQVDSEGADNNNHTQAPPTSDNLPWTEKYRPQSLEDLVSHKEIIGTITRLIDQNRLPHMLFYGPPGTGKTSTVLACARRMYGNNFKSMVLELNASDDRGIDVVRNEIKNFASSRIIFSSGIKLVVLDEADQMTSAAQAALRRVIEKFTRNTRFCLICNEVSRIIPAIQSRCTRFRFAPLSMQQCKDRVLHVIEEEGLTVTEDGMKALLALGKGDMRKHLNILQSTQMAHAVVDEIAVYGSTGSPLPQDVSQILNWLLNEDFEVAFDNVYALTQSKGLALADILERLHVYVLRLKIASQYQMELIDKLSLVEYRLTRGGTEKLQIGAVVSMFHTVKESLAA